MRAPETGRSTYREAKFGRAGADAIRADVSVGACITVVTGLAVGDGFWLTNAVVGIAYSFVARITFGRAVHGGSDTFTCAVTSVARRAQVVVIAARRFGSWFGGAFTRIRLANAIVALVG